MLRQEPDTMYIVYPPWAARGYAHAWADLPALLAGAGATGGAAVDEAGGSFRLIDGVAGGGVIVRPSMGRWHGFKVLRDGGANFPVPDDMRCAGPAFTSHVHYIEPYGGFGGVLATGRRPRNYYCRATVEHAASAGEAKYWVFDLKDPAGATSGLDQVAAIGAGFGLGVRRVDVPPAALTEEAAPWFGDSGGRRAWYAVDGGEPGVGAQFAFLLYAALHLKAAVRSLRWAHLVADVEGKVNVRRLFAGRRPA